METKKKYNPAEKHILSDVWNSYPEVIKNSKNVQGPTISLEKILGELYSLGDFYHYIINIADGTLIHPDDSILRIHNFKKLPTQLRSITDLIHPDDVDFVMTAEKIGLDKIMEIGVEHQLNLKTSYNFRMKAANGEYEMFNHQAIHTLKDQEGNLLQSLNIHTNINHITTKNSYVVSISGVNSNLGVHHININESTKPMNDEFKKLSKREMEILALLARGLTAPEIAEKLILSEHTIRTHRKNILNKMKVKNTTELVRKSIDLAII